MSNIQRDIFPQRGAVSVSKPQFALPVINQVGSQFTTSTFTAGTNFTIPSGSAGASVTIQLTVAPILGNNGRTGYFGNSSLSFGGALATTLATEVAFVSDSDGKGGDVTGLSNGQYMVDYETATVYGKRANTGTTGTAAYNSWTAQSSIGGGGASTDVNTELPTAAVLTDQEATDGAVPEVGAKLMVFNNGTAKWDRGRCGNTGVLSSALGLLNPLPYGLFETAVPALTNGNMAATRLDNNANLKVVVKKQVSTTTTKGLVSVDTTAGGTVVIAQNTVRKYALIQNKGSVDVFIGAGTITSSDITLAPGGDFQWQSQEAIKALSSSGSVNIAFIDFNNDA
jgi:hypothetical protein